MGFYTYDNPLELGFAVAAGTTAVNVPGRTGKHGRIKIIDAVGFHTATAVVAPANVINIGDGTTADLYGTITLDASGGANTAIDFTFELTQAGFEVVDAERIVLTPNITAGSVASLQVVVGYF